MAYSELEKKNAKEILTSLLYTREGSAPIPRLDVAYSDDIAECEPFINLINEIVGDSDTKLISKLPFDKYNKFDSDSTDHEFKITTIHNDVTQVKSFMEKFSSFYTLSEISPINIDTIISLAIDRTGAESISELKVSEIINQIRILTSESEKELSAENVDISKLKNLKAENEAIYAETRQFDDSLKILSSKLSSPVAGRWSYSRRLNLPEFPGYDPNKRSGNHSGVDICGVDIKSPTILSVADGTVISVTRGIANCKQGPAGDEWKYTTKKYTYNGKKAWLDENDVPHTDNVYGNNIYVNHNGIIAIYAHFNSILPEITKGCIVKQGQPLGIMGTSGNSTGIHLHFQLESVATGKIIDPEPLLSGSEGGGSSVAVKHPEDDADGTVSKCVTDINAYLTKLNEILEPVHRSLINRAASSVTEVYINDISGRVEEVELIWQPGTTISVPIEGEPAPVMQSLGGRIVKAIIHLKSVNPVELSKLALMFKVTNNHDTIASMLTLARSAYYSGSGARMKHLEKWYRADQIRKSLNELAGRTTTNLSEPVSIQNEILNSLGLSTFLAESFEVKSIDQAAHAYEVMVTFSYINLRNRNLETLRVSKHGQECSVLPLLTRTGPDENQKMVGTEMNIKFYSSLARISVSNCLAELLPIYCVSRIYRFYNAIKTDLEKSKNKDSFEVNMSAKDSIAARIFGNTFNNQAITDTFSMDRREYPSGYSSFLDKNISTEELADIVSEMSTVGGAITTSIFTESILKKVLRMGGMGGEVNKKAGIALSLFCGIGAAASAISSDHGTKLGGDSGFTINIPSIMPAMMWSFLMEYLSFMSENKEDAFLEQMATDVVNMVTDGNVIETSGSRRRMQFQNRITFTWINSEGKTSYSSKADGIDMTFLIPEIGRKETFAASYKPTGTKLYTGLFKVREMMEESRKSLANVISIANDEDRAAALISNTYIDINEYVVDAILLNTKGTDKLSDGTAFNPTDFYISSFEILNSSNTKAHCKECIRSILTSARLDVFAGSAINGARSAFSKDGNASSNTLLEKSTNHINMMEQYIAAASTFITNNNIDLEIISGCIADGTFLGNENVRKATCFEMMSTLSLASYISTSVDTIRSLGDKGNKIIDFVAGGFKVYRSLGTMEDIMDQVDPSPETIRNNNLEYIADALVLVLIETLLYIFIQKFGGKTIGLWLSRILQGIDLSVFIINILSDDAVSLVVGQARMFELSKWLSGQIKAGMDKSSLLNLCERSGIWMPSILNFGNDAFDRYQSSYSDFPLVDGPMVNGTIVPMSPDFFIHKIGFINDAYEELTETMNSMIAANDEMCSDIDNENMDSLLKKFVAEVEASKSQVIADFRKNVEYNLEHYAPHTEEGLKDYMKEIPSISDYIQEGFDCKQGILSISYNGITSKVTPYKSLVHIDIVWKSGNLIVNVSPNSAFRRITRNDKEYVKAMENVSRIIESSVTAASNCQTKSVVILIQTLTRAITVSLISFIKEYNGVSKNYGESTNDAANNLALLPGTLGNIMLMKSLVGTNMRSVGQKGMAYSRSIYERLNGDALRRATSFQAGYHFPTVKLYFIEEDSENFYLFDDLYSYASLLSVKIRMDKYSPQQVAVITVTNILGNLNNVMADNTNFEGNFIKGPSENADLNALLLKPGCKIKIQAGFTPILTEENTVFTGRITNLNFNTITTIEASSHGDVFLEDLSNDIVKIFGSSTAMYGSMIMRGIVSMGQWFISLWNDTYMTPSRTLRHLIKYLFNDLVQTSSRLTDFSLVPPVETQDGQLGEVHVKVMDIIKKNIYVAASQEFASAIGADDTFDLYVNQQLFENIYISGEFTDAALGQYGAWITGDAFWISKNETAWDVMNEMNLLLPNHMMTVRPYDTRGTLVWSLPDKYYRFKRSVDLDNIICNGVVNKLMTMRDNDTFKGVQLASLICACLNSEDEDTRAGGIALQSYWAFESQKIYDGYMESAPVNLKRKIKPEAVISSLDMDGMIDKSADWIYPCGYKGLDLKDQYYVNKLGHLLQENFETIAKESEDFKSDTFDISASHLSMSKIEVVKPTSADPHFPFSKCTDPAPSGYQPVVTYLVSLNFAAELIIDYMYDLAAVRSSSHRKASETHVKMSGRDIVRNDIQLNEPFNVIRISYPTRDIDEPEDLVDLALVGDDSDDATEMIIPVHYKLKPWAFKIYQTHFKNANAFKTARIPAIGCASSSILANLMKNTYTGSITLLGDPNIKEGDKIILWDENRDMFGPIGVKTHTLIIDPESGFISVIEPEMITRNDGKLTHSIPDTLFAGIGEIIGAAAVVLGVYWAYTRSRSVIKRLVLNHHIGTIASGTKVSRNLSGAMKSIHNIIERVPFFGKGLKKGRIAKDWFFNLKKSELASEYVEACIETKATTEFIVSDRFIRSVSNRTKSLNIVLSDESKKAYKQTENFVKNIKNISDSKITDVLNDAEKELTRIFMSAKSDDVTDYYSEIRKFTHDKLMKSISSSFDISEIDPDIYTQVSKHMSEFVVDHTYYGAFKEWYVAGKNAVDDIDNFDDVFNTSDNPRIVENFSKDITDFTSISTPASIGKFGPEVNDRIREMIMKRQRIKESIRNYVKSLDSKSEDMPEDLKSILGSKDAKTPEDLVNTITREIEETIIQRQGFIKALKLNWKKIIVAAPVLVGANWAYDSIKSFTEMYCLTKFTADKITVAPVMFRGEPMVAGLTGVTKEDGRSAGFFDIMKERISMTADGFSHAVKDPVANAFYRMKIAAMRKKNYTGQQNDK